jgi:hypothetical protein
VLAILPGYVQLVGLVAELAVDLLQLIDLPRVAFSDLTVCSWRFFSFAARRLALSCNAALCIAIAHPF